MLLRSRSLKSCGCGYQRRCARIRKNKEEKCVRIIFSLPTNIAIRFYEQTGDVARVDLRHRSIRIIRHRVAAFFECSTPIGAHEESPENEDARVYIVTGRGCLTEIRSTRRNEEKKFLCSLVLLKDFAPHLK